MQALDDRPRMRGRWYLIVLGAVLGGGGGGCGGDGRCDPDAPNTICTVVGSGVQGGGGDGGPAIEAGLYTPVDTAISPEGELWVLDFNDYVVRAVDKRGSIRTVVGSGMVGDDPPSGVTAMPAREASLNHVADLLFHGDYLYLAAWHNSRIKRVRLSDKTIENYAGRGRRTYYDGDGGPALESSLDLPSGIAFDPAGNLVVMDQANQVVRRIDGSGTIRTIAGRCVTERSACAPGEQPAACASLAEHAASHKLACGDPAMGCDFPCNSGYGGDGGPALEARMAQPYGAQADPSGHLAYDPAGNLVFADTENHRIRRVDTAGIITTIAGTGEDGYAGDGGPATAAQLNRPVDVEIAEDGTIYFTDLGNSCVRKIDPAGSISAVVGQCSPERLDHGFAGDGGPPLEAKLDRPYGIDLAGKKLYVSDSYNNRIRVVNLP
jgi:sugar lactone lactonase YvrE